MNFDKGKQPCEDFNPKKDDWHMTNIHECYGPLKDGKMQKNCQWTVSFCQNCYTDHHENGYETCGKEKEKDLKK